MPSRKLAGTVYKRAGTVSLSNTESGTVIRTRDRVPDKAAKASPGKTSKEASDVKRG